MILSLVRINVAPMLKKELQPKFINRFFLLKRQKQKLLSEVKKPRIDMRGIPEKKLYLQFFFLGRWEGVTLFISKLQNLTHLQVSVYREEFCSRSRDSRCKGPEALGYFIGKVGKKRVYGNHENEDGRRKQGEGWKAGFWRSLGTILWIVIMEQMGRCQSI